MRRLSIERCNPVYRVNSRAITNKCDIGDRGARSTPITKVAIDLKHEELTSNVVIHLIKKILSHHNQLRDWRRGCQKHCRHQTCN
eukprot:s1828_g2.t1